jgi:hypothetical protein
MIQKGLEVPNLHQQTIFYVTNLHADIIIKGFLTSELQSGKTFLTSEVNFEKYYLVGLNIV